MIVCLVLQIRAIWIDFYEQKKAKYTSDKFYIVNHTVSKDAVQVASMFFGGGGAVKGLKGAANSVEDGVRKTGKELVSEIDDIVIKRVDGADGLAKRQLKKAKEAGVIDADAIESGVNELNDIAAKKGSKLSWEEVQKFFKHGNDFNAKGRAKYSDDFVEVVLKGVDGKAGKRLDTYLPPKDGLPGQIISRKATTLSEIQPSTFRNYLNELITKYPRGAELNSSKFPAGTKLDGDYKLEIPKSNESFFNSNSEFQKVLNDFNTAKGVNIEIIYLVE